MNEETDRLLDTLAAFRYMDMAVPAHLHNGLANYVANHQPVGHFLTAVLENNLSGAVGKADMASLKGLGAVVSWLYNEPSSGCWGSPEKVKAWLEHGQTKV